MKVRSVQENDLNSVAQLFDNYRVWYGKTSDVEAAKSFLAERINKGESQIFVCDTSGDLAGFVQLYPLFSSTRMKKYWLLNDLYVEGKHRGKGLSIALIDRSKQLVQETQACGMFLETQITNTIGNKLYPRTGFKLNETTNFYEWEVG